MGVANCEVLYIYANSERRPSTNNIELIAVDVPMQLMHLIYYYFCIQYTYIVHTCTCIHVYNKKEDSIHL